MREHLRNDGTFRQLFGLLRPAIVSGLGSFAIVFPWDAWPWIILGMLAAMNALQILMRKQPMPVWTQKALVLVAASVLLTCALALFALQVIQSALLLIFIPLAQSCILGCAWLLFMPVDIALKQRIMGKAKRLRSAQEDFTVIGITGSVGKTTTKELIAHVLRDRHPLVTPSYVNSEMGIAQWLIKELTQPKTQKGTPMLIAELGAYRQGEIRRLCEILKPNLGVVTFIGKQHVALFGSLEALREAKGELLEALPPQGQAFLNADCDLCASLTPKARCPVTTVSTGGHADIEAFDIEETGNGLQFRVGGTMFVVPLHGTHNTVNVLLAVAVARHCGMQDAEIAAKLKSFHPLSSTFNVRTEGSVTVLDDTHNASHPSFKAAIAWARNQPAEQKVLLTSGLIELGEEQDAIHAEMGTLAAPVFSRVIFAHKRSATHFQRGYGAPVEILSPETRKVGQHALLACVGRIPASTIRRLLP